MTATLTQTEPTVVASHNVQALAQAEWFHFTANPSYSRLMDHPLVYAVQIKRTQHGEFFVDTTYAPVAQVHFQGPAYRSNGFATLAEAQADANRVWAYLRDEYVMEFGAHALACEYPRQDYPGSDKPRYSSSGTPFGGPAPMADGSKGYQTRQTLCPACQHFDTLTTTMEAYGNRTECSTPGCTHSTYYSIGD